MLALGIGPSGGYNKADHMDVIDDTLGDSFVYTPLSRETEAAAIPALWLSAKEEAVFQEWKDSLPAVLSLYTLAFAALHVLSVLLTGRMDTSGMPPKDKKLWHNKCAQFFICHRLSRNCLLYTSPSPRDLSTSRMPSSA